MKYVRTFPVSSTVTWLCSQTMSGNWPSMISFERLPISGISYAPTVNVLRMRYLGMAGMLQGRDGCRPASRPAGAAEGALPGRGGLRAADAAGRRGGPRGGRLLLRREPARARPGRAASL